jgi:hypothetical protein
MWAEVAEELNSTSDTVRSKWRSLRDGFTKRLKKIPVSTSGYAEVEISNYESWHYFKHLYFLKDQYTPHASSEGIPPNENKNLREDLTDTGDGGLERIQHSFQRLGYEKEQISSNASRADIQPKEKNILRAEQTDSRDGKLQSSQQTLKGSCHEKGQISSHASTANIPPKHKKTLRNDQTDKLDGQLQCSQHTFKEPRHEHEPISSHVSRADIPPKEKKILRTDQLDSQVGGLETSQYSGSGKELKPSAEVTKGRTGDPGLACSSRSISPNFKHLCPKKHQLTSHAGNSNLPPKKRKDFLDIQPDIKYGEVKTSQHNAARKKIKPSAEVPERRSGHDGLVFSKGSTSPNFKKNQPTWHAGSKDLPSKENKTLRTDQTHSREKGIETSKFSDPRKDPMRSAEVPKSSADRGLDFSNGKTSTNFKHLCPKRDQLSSHAVSKDLRPKKKKTLKDVQTDSRHEGSENSQFECSEKELKPSMEGPEKRCGDDGLDFSRRSTLPTLKHFCLQKYQLKTHASSGHIMPKENKTSRGDQTDTPEEKLVISRIIKFCGASADILEAETEASGPLSSNEQQAALSIESHTNNYSTRRSYETDVGNAPAKIERPKLKVSEDEQKARDEDIAFFKSLIPHTRVLSPARKMLLQIKTQELIYNFVYNQKC